MSGCALQLKQASQAWDEAPRRSASISHSGKQWGAHPTDPATDRPKSTPSTVPALPQSPGWQVPLPGLTKPSTPSPQDSKVLEIAQDYLGTPYRFGGSTPAEGFDCSGFVQYVFAQNGLTLKRQANEQFLEGRPISLQELNPGDLVFFSISGGVIDHVGLYAGESLFIHAPRTGRTVSYDSLETPYFKTRFQGARRLL